METLSQKHDLLHYLINSRADRFGKMYLPKNNCNRYNYYKNAIKVLTTLK